METFFGRDAEPLDAHHFFHLLWRERKRLSEFLRWTREFRNL
jgi:hypothetical protein